MAYATTTEADTYFTGTTKFATWDAIDEPTQALLLENASRYIDVAFKYSGTQTDEVLSFPRTNCVNSCTGLTYADNTIPVIVQNATCEIALQMNSDTEFSTTSLNTYDANVIKQKVSSLEVTYKDSSNESKAPKAYGYTWLSCIVKPVGGVGSYRVRKG